MRGGTKALLIGTAALGGIGLVRLALARDAALSSGTRVRILDDPTPADLSGAPGGMTRGGSGGRAVSGAARVVPPVWEPAALQALGRWEPPAPRTSAGRLAAYLWAAPLTLAGVLLGTLAGVTPTLRDGVLVYAEIGGLPGTVLRRRGFAAAAVGHVVLAVGRPSAALMSHELVHVRHAERLGPLSPVAYLSLLAVYGYGRHPFERAARRAQLREVTR